MRTIKFRGKDFNGKWLYGDLRHHLNKDVCIFLQEGDSGWPVQEETIGQFTGLLDKNGKEVYEGDIVDAWSAGCHSTCNVIKYVAPKFFISLINKDTGEISGIWHLSPNAFGKDELLEVIGNTHDNPELLEK